MPKDGLTVRPWFAWNPRDFYADAAVRGMDREQRWRYREAIDTSWLEWPDVAIGSEEAWRLALYYSAEQWPAVRDVFVRAMEVLPDGRWCQKRLRAEHDEWLRRVEQSREAGRSRQRSLSDRSATAQHGLRSSYRHRSTRYTENHWFFSAAFGCYEERG